MTVSNASNSSIRALTTQFAQAGKLEAIYLRPSRGIACNQPSTVVAVAGQGLQDDRSSLVASRNPFGSNRQVTLIQAEHITVLEKLLNKRRFQDPSATS